MTPNYPFNCWYVAATSDEVGEGLRNGNALVYLEGRVERPAPLDLLFFIRERRLSSVIRM